MTPDPNTAPETPGRYDLMTDEQIVTEIELSRQNTTDAMRELLKMGPKALDELEAASRVLRSGNTLHVGQKHAHLIRTALRVGIGHIKRLIGMEALRRRESAREQGGG